MKRTTRILGPLSLTGFLFSFGCGDGGSVPMLLEGVAGPFHFSSDVTSSLTTPNNPDNTPFYSFSSVYVQAVVNNVKTNDVIVAKVTTANSTQSFTAPETGNLGMLFALDSPLNGWPIGKHTVVVTTKGRQIGSINFNVN